MTISPEQSQPVLQIWKAVEQLYLNSKRHEAHWLWQNHVQVVANNASVLADNYGGNKDLSVIGALLHDIADIELERNHPAFEARTRSFIEKLMIEARYSVSDFNYVKDEVVDPHSCHPNNLPKTIEGKILATADAMAHLKTNFYRELKNEFFRDTKTDEQYREWVNKKLERDFNDKILFDEVRKEVEQFYRELLGEFNSNLHLTIPLTFKEFEIFPLTKELAEKYANEICQALDQIPLVESHTPEQLLSESKGDRIFHHKWDHSLIAFNEEKFAGLIVGYEREAEGNDQYPFNSIYVSDFAVSDKYQKLGLGKFLVQSWIDFNIKKGFLKLDGELKFSLQTNAIDWNKHVQRLYESFGFKRISEKKYDNRTDNVYLLEISV